MTSLDLAGLILVAARTLDLDQRAVLELADLEAAETAVAEARSCRGPEEAAAQLLYGLVRLRVFGPRSAEVALVAALQVLALNGRDPGDLGPAEEARELLAGIPTDHVGTAQLVAWLGGRTGQAGAHRKGRLPWRQARDRTEGTMFGRFTEQARGAVALAQEEARELGHKSIGTEHLLLGLLRERDGIAARVLVERGITLQRARAEVERIVGSGAGTRQGHIPFTPRAKKVLDLSLREAKRLHHDHIGTEHILLGLLREGEGVAAKVLVDAGANLGDVRESVTRLLQFTTGPLGARGLTREQVMGEIAALFDEVERLRAEVTRLRALLLRHGIEPDGGASRSA
jgi:Clp amino terminal domain, pathogenicity island component